MLRTLLTTISCIALAFVVPYAAIAADSTDVKPVAAVSQSKDAAKADAIDREEFEAKKKHLKDRQYEINALVQSFDEADTSLTISWPI